MSKFMKYASVAAREALEDANWCPNTEEQQEMTVRLITSDVRRYRN